MKIGKPDYFGRPFNERQFNEVLHVLRGQNG